MKLFYSSRSPFVRKVLITAHEVGLADEIELLDSHAHSVDRDRTIIAHNPLGQVPTMVLDDGTMLADSSVICAYLDRAGVGQMFPTEENNLWKALVDQAMGDGLMTASLIARYEVATRPKECFWQAWLDAHLDKIGTTLDAFERDAAAYEERFDIGLAAVASALSYLDLRFENFGWRNRCPSLAAWYASVQERPSIRATPLI